MSESDSLGELKGMSKDSILQEFHERYSDRRISEMSLQDYLEGCRDNPRMYASAAERLLAAIGEPEIVDTSRDDRLGRIFQNRTVRRYPAFDDFYGLEETIERVVAFLRHAAQGLEERKQITMAIQKTPEWPESCSGRRSAILATTTSVAKSTKRISWKVEK
jgi:serine protein kinase